MHRTYRLTALVALVACSVPCFAQATSNLPVIRPKVTELGSFRDTSLLLRTPAEASLSPRGTLIAYVTLHNDLLIWNVRTRTNYVAVKGSAEGVVWSPAGDAIAFAHQGEGSQEHIWTLRLNPVTGEAIGSAQRVSLVAATGNPPQFSPDGKSIAFPRADGGVRSSLTVVPTTGGTERVLASGFNIRHLRWAVNGMSIYYVSDRDSARTKAVMSSVAVNGGAPRFLRDLTTENREMSLSADNRMLLFGAAVTAGIEQPVRVTDLNGRALGTLSVPTGVEVPSWSGEYRQVGVRVTTPRGLRIVNVADGKSRQLIDSTADVQAVSWFDDNRRLAAIVFYDETGVLVTMNADGTSMRKTPLVVQPFRNPTVGHGFAPMLRVSPDGKYAAYQGPGRQSLELVDLSTGKQRTLTGGADINQLFWRRDSRTIRYMRNEAFAPTDPRWRGVHDVSLDGTDSLVRAFTRSQYPNAAWMVGENHVSIFGGNTFALARLDGSADQLLMRGSNTRTPGAISPDGRTMAVSPGAVGSAKASGKVILLSLSDGSQRSVDLPFGDVGCGFSPDVRYLHCLGREADSAAQTLYEVPIDGSKPRVVTRINNREFMGASVISPNGKWLLQTVAGVRRAAFVGLDFTDGMTRLFSSTQNP